MLGFQKALAEETEVVSDMVEANVKPAVEESSSLVTLREKETYMRESLMKDHAAVLAEKEEWHSSPHQDGRVPAGAVPGSSA